jgi:hypothetical protein
MENKMETPELDKMNAIQPKSQIIGEFLDWLLYEQRQYLCETKDGERFTPSFKGINSWLADYFQIDLAKVDQEQRALLAKIRKEVQPQK